MTREQRFEQHLQSMTGEAFNAVVEEIARKNFPRVWEVASSELLEEFNNDAVDKIRADWDLSNPETDETEEEAT